MLSTSTSIIIWAISGKLRNLKMSVNLGWCLPLRFWQDDIGEVLGGWHHRDLLEIVVGHLDHSNYTLLINAISRRPLFSISSTTSTKTDFKTKPCAWQQSYTWKENKQMKILETMGDINLIWKSKKYHNLNENILICFYIHIFKKSS